MKRRISVTALGILFAAAVLPAHAQQGPLYYRSAVPATNSALSGYGVYSTTAYTIPYIAYADGEVQAGPNGYLAQDPNARQVGYFDAGAAELQPGDAGQPLPPGVSPAPIDESLAPEPMSPSAGVCCPTGCDPFYVHRSSVFAEALFLKPRGGSDVAFALPRNGIDPATAVPYGVVGSNSPTYSPGFRVGATFGLDRCSSIYAAYTYFQAESNGSLFANPPLVTHSLVTLPQTSTTASDSLATLSRYAIRFQFADVDYRRLIAGGRNWYLNYAVGARYANLNQLFREAQPISPGVTGVATNVNFDGAGSRVGLLGARKAANRGFYLYGNAFADILVGNFRSSFLQTNNFQQTQAWTSWQSFRPVPILEYELGTGWQSPNGRWQFAAGYYFAVWFNTVTTSNYIQAVQNNNYVGVGNAITFDGLVLRGQRLW